MFKPVDYYNGQSPLSVRGGIEIYNEYLNFFSNDNAFQKTIQYRDIDRVSFEKNVLKISTGSADRPGELLQIFDSNAFPVFKAKYAAAKINFIKKFLFNFKKNSFKKKIIILFSLIAASVLVFLLFIQYAYILIPNSADIQIGLRVQQSIDQNVKLISDKEQINKVNLILNRVKPTSSNFKYSISIIDTQEINAISLPGGHIYVFSGLLKNSANDNEIAAVLAHEISHSEKRHGIRQLISTAGYTYLFHAIIGAGIEEMESLQNISDISTLLVFLSYSRRYEEEADLEAIKILKKNNIPPESLISFLEKIDQNYNIPSFISTHPKNADRINYIKKHLYN